MSVVAWVSWPSVTLAASSTLTVGGSSLSVMVPVASVSASVVLSLAFVGVPSLMTMVSSSSSRASPFTSMTMLPAVAPLAMVMDLVAGSM